MTLFYSITHTTRFDYSMPITESVMELWMQPRSDMGQRCRVFDLSLNPPAQPTSYRDYLGNTIHHFDIPSRHNRLIITARSLVSIDLPPALPDKLDESAWDDLDAAINEHDYWEMLLSSHFPQPTPLLRELARELNVEQRRDDPLSLLREINTAIHDKFIYAPESTAADSPIDVALECREGVCQDYSHIMIALARELRIPCRYVSGYLFHCIGEDCEGEDATHAWVEALLPGIGWVGFDPTNDLIAAEQHIRVAVGRDYHDVPPTRGVFKGDAESLLTVGVEVQLIEEHSIAALTEQLRPAPTYDAPSNAAPITTAEADLIAQQQMQQQQ